MSTTVVRSAESAPELMSPNDYLGSELAIANRIAHYERFLAGLRLQANSGNRLAARDLQSAESPDGIIGQVIAKLRAGEVDDATRFDMAQDYRHLVRQAFAAHRPVHADAVDIFGEELPAGYVRDGDRYCFGRG